MMHRNISLPPNEGGSSCGFVPKRAFDLAIAAGRTRQSPRTGFVHLFPMDEKAVDTIPLYENFCFAMALFRHKTAESILEGKSLVGRLLAFQAEEGNFPVYLHDYPRCWDEWMALRIAPILTQLVRSFSSVLGAELKDKLLSSIARALQFSEKRDRPPQWERRLRCLRQEAGIDLSAKSAEEWFEAWVDAQLLGAALSEIPYCPDLQAFTGELEFQERGEPRPWPIEWALAEQEGFSRRLLRDHPAVLRAALLFPIAASTKPLSLPYERTANGDCVRWLWAGSQLHSLSAPKGHWEDGSLIFSLDSPADPEKKDLVEAALYCDISSETELFIDGKKGMVFQLGELVQIRTPSLVFHIRFELLEGDGDFSGQISRANRPSQTACKGSLLYEAFDWRIAVRTLRRSAACRMKVCVEIYTAHC